MDFDNGIGRIDLGGIVAKSSKSFCGRSMTASSGTQGWSTKTRAGDAHKAQGVRQEKSEGQTGRQRPEDSRLRSDPRDMIEKTLFALFFPTEIYGYHKFGISSSPTDVHRVAARMWESFEDRRETRGHRAS